MNLFSWFRDASIKRKLLAIGMLTPALALLLVSVLMTIRDVVDWRVRAVSELSGYAMLVASNIAPAMMFDDDKAAVDTLSSLSVKPGIVYAAVYDDRSGKLFASYKKGTHADMRPELLTAQGYLFTSDRLVVGHSIRFNDETLGYIYIESDLQELYRGIAQGVLLIFLSAVGVLLLAGLVYAKLQKMFVTPILDMSDAMQQVIASQNFSTRVDAQGKDEIGMLGKTLNQMLEYIELRDSELNEHRTLLQERVELRTQELHVANIQLTDELVARQQALEQLRGAARELEQANAQIEAERALLSVRVDERTAQLTLANKAKDAFLATMSHEIRTPLGGLLGMMELLDHTALAQEQSHMLKVARSSGDNLLRIVDDILDWSKIEAGKMELAPYPASIADTVGAVANTYAQLAANKSISLSTEISPDIAALHVFDPLRLTQILNNYTSNAIKFTEIGKVLIQVQRVQLDEDGETIRFSVKDNGIGIDPQQQLRLFRQYQQASADTARMYGGTGLGLAICLALADLMQGKLDVESTLGEGATFSFTVRFPVHQCMPDSDATTLQATKNIEMLLPALDSSIRLLVIDDHPVNRMLLKQQLDKLGEMTVMVVASGLQGLSLWEAGDCDFIITDCHMPGIDGYELTRQIRERERQAGAQRIPIIAWTANALKEEADRCYSAGMDDVLTKPTELGTLRAMIYKWVARLKSSAAQETRVMTEDVNVAMVLDKAALRKVVTASAAQLELLDDYMQQTRSDIEELNAALPLNDAVMCADIAHRIKGASRMVGASELAAVSDRIERAALQGESGIARKLTESLLQAAFARMVTEIDEMHSSVET